MERPIHRHLRSQNQPQAGLTPISHRREREERGGGCGYWLTARTYGIECHDSKSRVACFLTFKALLRGLSVLRGETCGLNEKPPRQTHHLLTWSSQLQLQ